MQSWHDAQSETGHPLLAEQRSGLKGMQPMQQVGEAHMGFRHVRSCRLLLRTADAWRKVDTCLLSSR